ncbi:kinase-like domain-containing protein [Flammula alnicola]|nr:kinase-like domain-containing protein [Flammula alnicola]
MEMEQACSPTSMMSIFPEEQLDSTVGYFPAQLGQTLKDGQWTIARKLGWGPRSSTWLALNNRASILSYDAIKILTVAATEDSTGNSERNILLGPVKNISIGIPEMRSYFYEHDTQGKRHLCLVFHVYGTSVEDLRLTNTYNGEYLPLYTVQKVVGDVSERLAELAEYKIIHGGVTADNFLFSCVQTGDAIRKVLWQSKTKRSEKIVGSDGVTYPSVISQPIPHGFTWDCPEDHIDCATIYLSNFAHTHPIGGARTSYARKDFLAPEVLQKGNGRIESKSDVWMLGCTTYLLLTGRPLFSDSYISSPVATARWTRGKLESLLTECGKIPEKDVSPTASFLRSCLAIKPTDRASAKEIMNGGWAKSGWS